MTDTQNVVGATRYTVSADHGDRARHLTDLAAALRSVADELDQEAKSND